MAKLKYPINTDKATIERLLRESKTIPPEESAYQINPNITIQRKTTGEITLQTMKLMNETYIGSKNNDNQVIETLNDEVPVIDGCNNDGPVMGR